MQKSHLTYHETAVWGKIYVTTLFFFFLLDPPDVPQKLNFETHDFKEIICTWDPGRPTGLVGPRETDYTLFER